MPASKQRIEFGDFQTPEGLAREVSEFIARRFDPCAVLEPNCGTGSFLLSALKTFRRAAGLGMDINEGYVERCRDGLRTNGLDVRGQAIVGDFFATDWRALTQSLADPLLLVGNPPWVTNSCLGVLQSGNLPKKSNFQSRNGFDAKTGSSNFDISEAMLIRLIDAVAHRPGTVLAFLCKTGVARRLLLHAHHAQLPIGQMEIRRIDANAHFGVAVDACLFCTTIVADGPDDECLVFEGIDSQVPERKAGVRNGQLIADIDAYDRFAWLDGGSAYSWRSGVKHDCSRVMEVTQIGDRYRNGLGESCELEGTLLYPLLKSSHLRPGREQSSGRKVLVTQAALGEDTAPIAQRAPLTWRYLMSHADRLDSRRSSIYRNRPRFSMFGIGPYTFAPWKVAISGLYKRLEFVVVGPIDGRPTVLDDTAYFLPCESEREAVLLGDLLNSPVARDFLSSLIFWDSKRPITSAVLSRLNLPALAADCGKSLELKQVSRTARVAADAQQPRLAFRT